MPTLPIAFPGAVPPAIASYDYTDVAEGTGITKFYGFETRVSGTKTYHLGTSDVFSTEIEQEETIGSSSWTLEIDDDFDLPAFNLPRKIKGTATVTFSWYVRTGVSADGKAYATVNIRKWDGTTETELVSGETDPEAIGATTSALQLVNMPLTIPDTHFKRGDILRLTIRIYGRRTTATATVGLGVDPQNRDGTYLKPSSDSTVISKIEFYCPFKIDL